MKKFILIVLGVITLLILIVAGGLAYFIATFDANHYRPIIEEELTKSLGNPATLQDVSLSWQNGIALSLTGLQIYSDDQKTESVLEIPEADALLRLSPLFKKDIQIGKIHVKNPKLEIIQDIQGNIRISGLSALSKNMQTGAAASAAPLPFLIDTVQIDDAEVNLKLFSISPKSRLTLRDLDVVLKDVSLLHPVRLEVKAALFSQTQNASLKTTIRLPSPGKETVLNDTSAEIKLETINPEEVTALLPTLKLKNSIQGTLSFKARELHPESLNFDNTDAELSLKNGSVGLSNISANLENVSFHGTLNKSRLNLDKLFANLAGGSIEGTLSTEGFRQTPQHQFDLQIKNIPLLEVLPVTNPRDPQLEGILSAQFKGYAQGLTEASVLKTLAGEGNLSLTQGIIRNFNVIQEVFARLSMLPGLVDKLQSRLPETYQAKLQAPDTPLEPIELPFSILGGVIQTNKLRIASDTFEMTGVGSIILGGPIDVQTMLSIDPELSNAFIRSVQELQYLADQEGRLQIPFRASGVPPQIAVFPDLQYVASRLAVSKAQELIGGFLNKKSGQENPNPEDTAVPATAQGSAEAPTPQKASYQDLLGGLLQEVLREKEPQ